MHTLDKTVLTMTTHAASGHAFGSDDAVSGLERFSRFKTSKRPEQDRRGYGGQAAIRQRVGEGRSRSARGTESLQTLCRREPNSNHHSLSYDLPRTELDRVGPAHADLCRDFFSRAVVLELSFFEAAYTSLCAIGNIRTCTTKVRLRLCAHARDECRSQSTGPECTQNRKNLEELEE